MSSVMIKTLFELFGTYLHDQYIENIELKKNINTTKIPPVFTEKQRG